MPPDAVDGLCARCLARVAFGERREKAEGSRQQAEDERAGGQEGATITVKVEPDVLLEAGGGRIGRYKLLEKIGEGGFGLVYMAEQVEPVQRKVALKIIKAGMDTHAVIARFEAERQALALMDHPNIARVLDAGATAAGRPYFVMELVQGIPITDYCDQYRLSPAERLGLFIEVCHAVQHAHQKGIIHRDLKPSNVLVTLHDGEPVPKVIDFGIAKALGQKLTEKTLFTGFGQMIGTPAYMSPEQAELSGLDVDTRSDIYSLGALLYELLTGVTPFDKETLARAAFDEVRRMIRETEPLKPSTRLLTLGDKATEIAQHRHVEVTALNRVVRGDLDWIVMKCLEKDRTRRYETANGLAHDIERHLSNEPVLARPPSRAYQFRKLVLRNRLLFGAAGAVAVALLLGLGVSTWLFFKEKAARQRAVAAEQGQTRLRHKAETEAAKSHQVAGFLEDTLQGVGPSVALGRDTTMLREILDQTAKRVSQDLTNQPEVEAELLRTIGGAYAAIGHYQVAEDLLRRQLALQTKLVGERHLEVAASLDNLASVLLEERKSAEAEMLGRQGLTVRRQLLGAEHADVAASLHTVATALVQQGRLAEAEALHHEAVAMARKVLGADHSDLCRYLGDFGAVLAYKGLLAEAASAHREALSVARRRPGNPGPDLIKPLNNLAVTLSRQGQIADAEPLLREALRIATTVYGSDDVRLGKHLMNVAVNLRGQGKFTESEAVHREWLQWLQNIRTRLPSDDPEIAIALIARMQVLFADGRFAEAESLARECLAIRERRMPGTWPTFNARSMLGTSLLGQGKHAEAERLLLSAYEGLKAQEDKIPPYSKACLAETMERLARLYETTGRPGEAAEWRNKLAAR